MFKKLVLFITLLIPIYLVAGIPLSSNFTVNTALPIEDRMSVADITARDAISSLRRWEGMLVYVVADGKHYTLIGGITNGDWSEISGSGGAGSGLLSFIFKGTASDIATYYQAPSVSSYITGALTTVPTVVGTSATLMGVFATNVGFPNVTSIPTGFFTAHYETDKVAGANNYYTYFEVYKRTVGGAETLLATSDQTTQTAVNTSVQQTASAIIVAPVSLLATDRIIVKIYGVLLSSSATVDLLFDDTTNARLELPSATVDATNFVPYVGATKDLNLGNNNIRAANYDKDNLLVNGNIENSLSSEWTCTVGTCTRTTVSGEFSKDTAALKVALSAQAMNVSQTVTTPSGIQKQGFARVIYRVPATMADFQICSLVDGVEQNCIPTNNLIKDDTFRPAEIPLTFGTTSAGIKFKTTSSYTANAYFDGAILAQGLGTQNLQGDTVYSAFISSTGVVSQENKDWISGNGSGTNPMTLTFVTGTFTVAPNCTASSSGRILSINSTSSSNVVINQLTIGGASGVDQLTFIICQKSGNDYLAASSNVYASSAGQPQYSHYSDGAGNGSTATMIPYFSTLSASSGSSLYTCSNSSTLGLSCTFLQPANIRVSLTCFGTAGNQCGISKNASSLTTTIYNTADSERIAYAQGMGATTYSGTATANIIVNTGDIIRPHTSGMAMVDANSWLFTIAATQANNVIVGSFDGIEKCRDNGECDDTFSAQVSSSGTVTSENINWINGNCTVSDTSLFTCPYVTNLVTTSMSCVAGPVTAIDTAHATITSGSSSTQSVIRTGYSAGGVATVTKAAYDFKIICQKQGVDYKPKTAKVASSIGVPTVPGVTTEAIDTFSVSYGATATTACTTGSTCAYSSAIGSSVSVGFVSTGLYLLTTPKVYAKLRCSLASHAPGVTVTVGGGSIPACDNCSSKQFDTVALSGGAQTNSFGTLMCQGSY